MNERTRAQHTDNWRKQLVLVKVTRNSCIRTPLQHIFQNKTNQKVS